MKLRRLGIAVLTVAFAVAGAAAADPAAVPVYTSEDLDRMFGPAPTGQTESLDRARPEDWRWVEQFIDRQYARVDADRQYDLQRHQQQIDVIDREQRWPGYYGGPVAWGLGYPASTWWNGVWSRYAFAVSSGSRNAPAARAGWQAGWHGGGGMGAHGNVGHWNGGQHPRSR